ncbi:hypothetical protein D6851_02625 [Altericroceibacterium spongiae]|uniref:Uncharacterized protein n=1 Tax=Altericroceibacterium spongiae TaxID=2320269 RepID=A0A420ERR7_9SPHN|nr:hypothetical protein [Altericroceibacterium spongiae]RKF23385.1 hypothetical protein D6851_02625 [Altericroceibacterium spongiae]
MASQWDEWLQRLRAAGKGGVSLPPAFRGDVYSTPVTIAGDWTGASLRGDVSASPDAAAPLVSFTVSEPVFDQGYTIFTLFLTGTQTGDLPADSDLTGAEDFPFTLWLTPDGEAEEVFFGGLLPLMGKA